MPSTPPFALARRHRLFLLAVGLVAGLALTQLTPGVAYAQTNCGPDTHQSGTDPEVLVGTSPTRLPQLCGRTGLEIQNLGPNPIWCVASFTSSHARVNRARKVDAGATWSILAKDAQPVWCVASTAAQVAGAATIVSEVR